MADEKDQFNVVDGEAVGTLAAQSIGEPGTQMLLRTFHQAGVASMITIKGLPRVKEIVDARKAPKTPLVEVWLEKSYSKSVDKVNEVRKKMEEVRVRDTISGFEENFKDGSMKLFFSKEKLSIHEVTAKGVLAKLAKSEGIKVEQGEDGSATVKLVHDRGVQQSVKDMRVHFVQIRNMTIVGVKGISKASIDQAEDGVFYLLAIGDNIQGILEIEGVDPSRVYSNNIFEVARVFGVEAARTLIQHELSSTIHESGITVSMRHLGLVADAMTLTGAIKSVGRHGIVGGKNSVFARAAYEETVKHFVNACVFSEKDMLSGVAENILIGKQVGIGTGTVKLMIKKEDLRSLKAVKEKK